MSINIYSNAHNVERKFADPITESQNSAASDIANTDEQWLLGIYSHWSAPAIKKSENRRYSTLEYTLDGSQILKYWRSPRDVIALRFGSTTREIVLDIDVDSPYLHEDAIRLIRHTLEDVGLSFCILHQSSESGGIHLRFPLPEERNTYAIARTVEYALARTGFLLRDGHLEVFPNRKAWVARGKEFPKGQKYDELYDYKAVRLPCQQGYVLLDECLNPFRNNSLAQYRQCWEWCVDQQDMELLDQMIEFDSDPKNYPKQLKKFGKGGKLADIQKDHEELLERGFEGNHETNWILMDLTRRIRILEPTVDAEDLARKTKETVTAMPGYQQYCRHQREIGKRCLEWARCCIKKGYYYHGDRPKTQASRSKPKGLTNEEKQTKACTRFQNCLKDFVKNQFSFPNKTKLIAAVLKKVGGSKSTIQKYWEKLKKLAASLILEGEKKVQEQRQNPESKKASSKTKSKSTDPLLHSVCFVRNPFCAPWEVPVPGKEIFQDCVKLGESLRLASCSYLFFNRLASSYQSFCNLLLPVDLSYRSIPSLLDSLEEHLKRLGFVDSSRLHHLLRELNRCTVDVIWICLLFFRSLPDDIWSFQSNESVTLGSPY